MAQSFNGNVNVDGSITYVDNEIQRKVTHVPRTATVVVGLESSGYTQDQVDIFIQQADNVTEKLMEAVAKLPSMGGEIKLLEGDYSLASHVLITKSNVSFMGCGNGTLISNQGLTNIFVLTNNIVGFQLNFCKIQTTYDNPAFPVLVENSSNNCEMSISNVEFDSRGSYQGGVNIYDSMSKANISNCRGVIVQGITALNWRNVNVDGNIFYQSSRLSDIPYFISQFITSGEAMQISNDVSNFKEFNVFAKECGGWYEIRIDLGIMPNARILTGAEADSFLQIKVPSGLRMLGVVTTLIYAGTALVAQFWGQNEYFLGTTATGLLGKTIRSHVV